MVTRFKVQPDRAQSLEAPVLESTSPRPVQLSVAALVPVCLALAAALVYGPATSFVYAEYSDFATQFGSHPWYTPLGFGDILGKYFALSQGWYRPTSFYAIPYLLRLDYFQPGSIVMANVAFFVLAASSVLLLVRNPPFAIAFFIGVSILFAPTLYLVTYGVQIDSLYILFGVAFVAFVLRLQQTSGQPSRRLLWFGSIVAFSLAITSKEISVILPFLVVPLQILAAPALTRQAVGGALRTAAPFMAVSLLFVVVYKLGRPPSGGVYDTSPYLDKLSGAVSLTTWTFGFRSPVNDWSHWIPPWGSGEKLMAVLRLLVLGVSVAIAWRRLQTWRVLLFAAAFAGLALAIALPGGLPHHAFPLVVLAAAGGLAAMTAAGIELRRYSPMLSTAYLSVVGVVAVLQIVQAHATYGGVLYRGPQSAYLRAGVELFYGSTLAPVRAAQDPLFVFEDCLGGLHNPLRYYAKAGDGQEISVSRFNPAQFQSLFAHTARQGRESFVAQCTGVSDPWYRLLRYDPRARRLMPA